MISFLKAVCYVVFHPFDPVYLTVVRRYADAQKHYIGELYMGEGRTAKMIGMSCDSLPFDAGIDMAKNKPCRFELDRDFLQPMEAGALRVGALEPKDNDSVRNVVALRRFCPIRVTFLNRFIERVMESEHV